MNWSEVLKSKFILTLIFLTIWFSIVAFFKMNNGAKTQPTIKPPIAKISTQQLKACQDVIGIDQKVLSMSSDMLGIINETFTALQNNNPASIDLASMQIESISQQIGELKKEVEPLARKCFKE